MHTPSLNASRKTKSTPIGELPVEWELRRVEGLASRVTVGIVSAATHAYRKEGVVLFRNANIREGFLVDSDVIRIDPDYERKHSNKRLRAGDVVTVRTRYPGLSAVVEKRHAGAQVFTSLITRPRPEIVDSHYLCMFINSPVGVRQFAEAEAGGAQKNVNAGVLRKMLVILPPLREQRKIVETVASWDRAIERMEKLIAAKKQLKHGLMQQLLAGQERFKEFVGERWHTFRLGELLEPRDRYVNWSEHEAYQFASIRRRSGGLFDRGTFYGREVKTKVLKLLNAGDFAISKRQIAHGAWVMVTDSFDGFGVSDEYDVLVNRNPKALDMRFFSYLAQTRQLRHMAFLASNGVHIEKLIFVFRDFARLKVKIPSRLEEQTKIADLLTTCDHEIHLLQAKLSALQNQKRGLMQKLLTGKVRVTHLLTEST